MILDMQGGFLTKERGGVDVKVSLQIYPYHLPINLSTITVKYIHLHMFQGKGLMQTFWLIEEVQKQVSPPKNRGRMN